MRGAGLDLDVSEGRIADPQAGYRHLFPPAVLERYEIYSYRNAAGILATGFPAQFATLLEILTALRITRTQIRTPGGSKGPIVRHIETLFPPDWVEARINADLHVRLVDARGGGTIRRYMRRGYLDGHRIDFVNGKVALDLEWNSKDQTYDRDLAAFAAFYEAGAIDVGIILTRGAALDSAFFRSLGRVLDKDGREGREDVYRKFGASTTWMGKLLYRLDAGRNGGCPVLAIGITPACVD